MQRNNDNKYPPEENAFVTNPASANVIENLNATSSHADQNPTAKAMRSGQQREVAYEIAGPTFGGMAPQTTPYNPDSITDSMSKAKISEGNSTTANTTTTTKPMGATLTDSFSNAGAKAAGAVGAVAAGATAAGNNLINAAKNLVSHHDAPTGSMESPHPHPIADMSGKATDIKSQTTTTSTPYTAPRPANIEPIHSTGLNNPVAATHHYTTQVPKGEVATAGVIGAASATVAAPPMNDTIKATPEEHHLHERRSSIKDKVKNVFHRRPSAQAAAEAEAAATEAAKPKVYDANMDRFEAIPETPYTSSGAPKADLHAAPGKPAVKLDAHPTTTLNQGHNSRRQEALVSDMTSTSSSVSSRSRPLSEKVTAPVVGAAAATGTAAYMGYKAKDAKDAAVDSTGTSTYSNKSATATPHSTPVVTTASSYTSATTPPVIEDSSIKTTTAEPSRPLTEKIAAPAVGAAAAGTAAYVGNRAKDTTVGSGNNVTHDQHTTGNYVTHGQHTTTTSNTTPAVNSSSYTTPGISTASYSTPTVEKTTMGSTTPSHPMTGKITVPVAGATAVGTAAYMGNKAKDAKDSVTGTGNTHDNSSYTTTTPSITPAVSSYSTHPTPMNASSHTTGAIPAPAPTSYSKTTNTTSSSGATPVQVQSADKIAIPTSYKGPIPKAGPGEEVVWIKTTTTTDYYDTDKLVDTNGDVVETHQNVLDPNSFQTEHDNVTTYVNDGHGGQRPLK